VRRAEVGARISDISTQSAKVRKGNAVAVMGAADPQANLIARLTGQDLETVQTGLMLFVALLIEIGSGFGLYVAFAYWRPHQSLHEVGEPAPGSKTAPAEPLRKEEETAERLEHKKGEPQSSGKDDPIWTAEATTASGESKAGPPAVRPFGDNDNKSTTKPAIMPPNDVQRFYQDCVDGNVPKSSYVESTRLNEAYKIWCKKNGRRPLVMPNFLADFDQLKVEKHEIGGGVKYFGIALKPGVAQELEQKGSRKRRTAMPTEAAQDQPAAEPSLIPDEAAATAAELRAAAGEMQASLEQEQKAAPGGKARAA
jgi:hypothetical protein